MSQEYTQIKDIKLQDILGLADCSFRTECISQLLECGFIKKIEKDKKTYCKGQEFKEKDGGVYILAQVNHSEMCLISIKGVYGAKGNHWTSPVRVENSTRVTEQELEKMSGSCGKFGLIKE